MNYVFTAIELATGKHLTHYLVPIPTATEDGFYNVIRSLNAFCFSGKKRNWSDKVLYLGRRAEEYRMAFSYDPFAELTSVKDLWTFYDIIGYDKKTKKFTK